MPDLDDVQRVQDLDGLADAGAAGAESLAQGGLGGQRIPGAKPFFEDVPLDAVDDFLPEQLPAGPRSGHM